MVPVLATGLGLIAIGVNCGLHLGAHAGLDRAVRHRLERHLRRSDGSASRTTTTSPPSYPPFWTAVRNNVLWLAFLGLIATPFGLFCAVLLDRRIRFCRLYQGALYMPVVLSLAVVGFIAQLVYSQDYGVLNAVTGTETRLAGRPSVNIWVVMVAAAWRHVGYVMIIYLAGLKAVDPALKEAAAIDGASETQAFFRVVFPTLRPINVIVLVITVIEALRAFDIVYAINKGRNGLELLSVLVTENIVGEASRIGFGSAIAVVLLVISMGFIVVYLTQLFGGGAMSHRARRRPRSVRGRDRRAAGAGRADPAARLPGTGGAGLVRPAALALYASLRPYQETPDSATSRCREPSHVRLLQRGVEPGRTAQVLPQHAHHRGPGRAAHPAPRLVHRVRHRPDAHARPPTLLIVFTAGNLLPPQVLITPL